MFVNKMLQTYAIEVFFLCVRETLIGPKPKRRGAYRDSANMAQVVWPNARSIYDTQSCCKKKNEINKSKKLTTAIFIIFHRIIGHSCSAPI